MSCLVRAGAKLEPGSSCRAGLSHPSHCQPGLHFHIPYGDSPTACSHLRTSKEIIPMFLNTVSHYNMQCALEHLSNARVPQGPDSQGLRLTAVGGWEDVLLHFQLWVIEKPGEAN